LTTEIAQVFIDAGIPGDCIWSDRSGFELPGYFRAEKKWDIVVVYKEKLIAAIELKTIWGSYGNNINNRAEEAIGSAYDLAKALRAGLVGDSAPWIGYVFVIKDDPNIRDSTRYREPHYKVDPVFVNASYLKRFELLCSRLVTERLYDKAWYVCLDEETGNYREPNEEMTWNKFKTAIQGKVAEVLA
jgi:hypothetical protein